MDHRARRWWNRLLGRKSRGDSKDRKESRGGSGAGPGSAPYKEDSDAENRKPDEPLPNGRKSGAQASSKSAQVRSKCNPKLAESSNTELSKSPPGSGPFRHHLSVSHSGRFKEKRKQRGTVSDRPELYNGPPKPLETDL